LKDLKVSGKAELAGHKKELAAREALKKGPSSLKGLTKKDIVRVCACSACGPCVALAHLGPVVCIPGALRPPLLHALHTTCTCTYWCHIDAWWWK
jgi:hypothetical protein